MTDNPGRPPEQALGPRTDATAAQAAAARRPSAIHRTLSTVDRVTGGRADWVVRFISYAMVGGTAAVVNLLCFSLLYYRSPINFGSDATAQAVRYVVVFVIAAEISILANFSINDRVTFSKLPGHARSWIVRCLRFHLTTILGTLLTFIISFTLAHVGLTAVLAQTAAIGIVFLVNFTMHHVFTYSHLHTSDGQAGGMGRPAGTSAPADVGEQATRHGLPLKLSLVIPAHNEEEALRPTISRLYQAVVDEHIPFEILVVNDHSTDGTEAVLRQLAYEFSGVRYVSNEKPGGFGRAIQTGLEHFAGDAVCIVMADASDDPRDVVTYYRKLQEGYECVFGSRFVAGSKVVDYPRHKLFVNRMANWFINILFQLHFNDTTNAFKAYRREVIAGISPVLAQHFNITVELPLKAITRGYNYTVVPINWYNRATGVSKLKIQEMGSRYLFIVLYVWLERLLSRGDYRRPGPASTETNQERERSLVWSQYETMPHKVPQHADIAEIDTAKIPIVTPGQRVHSSGSSDSSGSSPSWRNMALSRDGVALDGYPPAPAVRVSTVSASVENGLDNGARSKKDIPAWLVWLATLVPVLIGLLLYWPSISILPLSDDWGFLEGFSSGSATIFFSTSNYHYNPVVQGLQYVIYLFFGINGVPYHILTLTLFSVGVALVLHLAWKVTGSFTVGIIASLLFVLSGRQYEAVTWTLVSNFQTLGLALYLGGLLFYLHAQGKQGGRRLWMLIGFYACMVLAVFTYEQEVTLVVACMLYRFFVLDRGRGLSWNEMLARGRTWLKEFGFPVVFFAAYLGFKYYLSLTIGRSQAPGLQGGLEHTLASSAFGLYQSFTPAITSGKLWTPQLRFLFAITSESQPVSRWLHIAAVFLPLIVVVVFAKPAYRWLALWSLLVVMSTILGIGYVASRYQLLFIVPAVILWAGFFVWVAKLLRKLFDVLIDNVAMIEARPGSMLRRVTFSLAWVPAIAMIAVFGALGARGTTAQVANWQKASTIEGAAIQRIADLGATHPDAQTLYLVNLPDNVGPALPNPVGASSARSFRQHVDRGAYLFQDGAATMVKLTVPDRFNDVYYVRSPDYFAIGTSVVIPRTQLDALSQSTANLVVCFSQQTQQIEVWGPLCT